MKKLVVAGGALLALVVGEAGALTSPDLETTADAGSLEVSFANTALWNGEDIPKSMECPRNGGSSPHSPELVISGVPAQAKALVVFFRNRKAQHNHGLVKYTGAATTGGSFVVPAIPHGATTELPQGISVFQGGTDTGRSKGAAFWAPCPSRGYWRFEITVYAVDANDKVVASKKIKWGGAPS